MSTILGANSYGKSGIRVVTVVRRGSRHELRDLTVSVRVEGDFDAAHESGDNANVLPTDTMKNTVYALARANASKSIERFAEAIASSVRTSTPAASCVSVEIAQHEWQRVRIGTHEHDHSFVRGPNQRRLAWVRSLSNTVEFEAGISDLSVLKTTRSAFSGFLRDEFTTLRDTSDRILATQVDARWRFESVPESFDLAWRSVRGALVETFADHDSESVQHTLFAMGSAALDRCEDVVSIHLTMPNKHHLLVDLAPFGQENANEVFVATDAPYGLIEATVTRAERT